MSKPNKEEIVQHYQGLVGESRSLQQKVAELRQERGEHELVGETLRKADSERKCWRLVGKIIDAIWDDNTPRPYKRADWTGDKKMDRTGDNFCEI